MLPNKFKPQLAIDFAKVKTQPKNQVMSVKIDGILDMIDL